MNTFRLPALVILSIVAVSYAASAQTAPLFENESAYIAPESQKTKVASTLSPYRFHKKLQKMYSGYAIEVAASNYPLERNDAIFRQFGNVHYDKLIEGGYSYLILANFDSDKSALHFLQTIIQPKANEARLFLYKDGNRKIIRE
ncbi:MAG: hypothetical protein H6577_20100 [Lewinellaceae bacterium]|nr:hypothetical protein [Saprospiraceae bacterium]MCB9340432.1 hypothetical protein [Lewinellaceae bacterium]